jgi:hypothetical protein
MGHKSLNRLFYDRKIPHLEIIKILRRYEEQQRAAEVEKLKGTEISFGSDQSVINLDEAAKRYGVGLRVLKRSDQRPENARLFTIG